MYDLCIVENEERNQKYIIEPTLKMLEEERQVLVLVQLIDHGHILNQMFLENGLKPEDVRFIWGDTPDKIRTKALQDFREGKFKVFIGSTIMDAGINIKTISGVVLGGAGNSDITLIQRIGRGARTIDYEKELGYTPKFIKENNGVKVTKVYDIIDKNSKFFHNQSVNRYKNASEEFGVSRVHIVGGDSNDLRKGRKTSKRISSEVDQFASQLDMLEEFRR